MRGYTIFDLLKPPLLEELGQMIGQADIKLNEKEQALFQLAKPSSKIAPAQPMGVSKEIKLSVRAGPDSLYSKKEHQISERLKQNFAAFTFCLRVLAQIVKRLQIETVALASHKAKLIEIREAIKELMLKHTAELNKADLQVYLDQKFDLEVKMLERIMAAKFDVGDIYSELFQVTANLSENMAEIKEQKHAALEEYTEEYAQALENYASPTGKEYFKSLSKETRHAFLKDFFYEDRKYDKQIKKEKKSQASIESRLDALFKERRERLHQLVMKELQGRIQVSQEPDRLRPQRLTTLHGMEREGLKDLRVLEIDDEIRKLSQELRSSTDKLAILNYEKENLLTKIALKYQLEPLANASKEEKAYFLAYCEEKKSKVFVEMDKWSDLRQQHKKQKNALELCHQDLQQDYSHHQRIGTSTLQVLNQTENKSTFREKLADLTKQSHALDMAWQERSLGAEPKERPQKKRKIS